MKKTLFDQSYQDFKKIYFSREMAGFIQEAHALKKRCARLFIVMLCSGLFFLTLYIAVYCYIVFRFLDQISLNWLIIGGCIAYPAGMMIGSKFDKEISFTDYYRYYADNLSDLYSRLLDTNIRLQSNDTFLNMNSPFREKKKVAFNVRNKGFSLNYRKIRAQLYIDMAVRSRKTLTVIRHILTAIGVYAAMFILIHILGKYSPFAGWMLKLDRDSDFHFIMVITYLIVTFIIMMIPFAYLLYQCLMGLTATYLSISGISSIDMQYSVIWIKRRLGMARFRGAFSQSMSSARNRLRFNRIALNRDFEASVELAGGENLSMNLIDAKVILSPMIEDLLLYINKKYTHFDIAISRNRVDIQFLDDMMRKNNKVLNQLMNPRLFSPGDLYIGNMYRFYEIVELVKLFHKYFYCGEEAERVTAEERALLERSAELEKIPSSHFKKNNRKFLRKILQESKTIKQQTTW